MRRVRADSGHCSAGSLVLLDVPPAQGASLGHWLSCAALVAEVGADGVIVRVHANRIFRLADLARLVREWMQAHAIDVVLARNGALPDHPSDERSRPMKPLPLDVQSRVTGAAVREGLGTRRGPDIVGRR